MSSVLDLLAAPRYEVIPLDGAEEAVLEHVPREVTVTVTTSPAKGLEPTLALSELLAAQGYRVVPHLAARHVRDPQHLAELVERLRPTGASDILVIAGDASTPAGEYEGSLPFLQALAELDHPFRDVGITGYPERHALISDGDAVAALDAKEAFATYIVSQICFAPEVTATWMRAVWERGTRLPVYVGLPGVVPGERLLRVCDRIRVGESTDLLRADAEVVAGVFEPTGLLDGLGMALGQAQPNFGGLHIFTFNQLAETEAWRRRHLAAAVPT